MTWRTQSHLRWPASDGRYLLSTGGELGAGLCISGDRETEVLKECADVNIHSDSQVGIGTGFYGSPWWGGVGGWDFGKTFKETMLLELALEE